jgi:hypothetical protein
LTESIAYLFVSVFIVFWGIKNLRNAFKNPSPSKYGAEDQIDGWLGEKIFGEYYAPISYFIWGSVLILCGLYIFIHLSIIIVGHLPI